jgi:Pyruvate/2-oxoacid:ferredoxin oxidoreductase delta subunit
MGWEWKLVTEQCTGCGICADVCPHGAVEMTREMAYPEPSVRECVGCLMCIAQCPFEAIEVRELSSVTGQMDPAGPRA